MRQINTVYQGDSLELMGELDAKSVDLVLTDIPYGKVNRGSNGLRNLDKGVADIVDFNMQDLVDSLTRVTKGSIYVFCGTEQVSELRARFVDAGMSTRLVIWNKTNPSPMNGQYIWLSSVECCVYGKFPKATFNEHCKGSVLNFPNGRSKVHKTEKPLKMFEYLVGVSSNEGDLVLDPFAGSGTTGVACKNLKRDFILMEKEPEYVELIRGRLNAI
jgi:DNA modification methylase